MDPAEDVEALRRRLYRADVTEEDRRRYASTLAAGPEPESGPEPPAAARSRFPRPSRFSRPAWAAVAVCAVVALAAVVLIGRPTPHRVAAAPSAAPTARTILPSQGVTTTIDGAAAPSAAPTARTILPSQGVTTTIDGAAVPAMRVEGVGPAEVPLDLSHASYAGGRIDVVLSASDERSTGWRAVGLVTRRDWSTYRRVTASAPLRDRLQSTRPDESAYAGAPPMWIDVQGPADAAWTLTVAFRR